MKNKPNIVIIMTDQQQAALRRSEGFALDTMPFLGSMARRGVDIAKAYTVMPVCAPARVSMFTGRYPSATHVKTNHNIEDAYYAKDLIDVLKEHGYKTALCGKNHSHKNEKDFDYCYELGHDGGWQIDRTKEEAGFDNYLKSLRHRTDLNPAPFGVECQGPYRSVSRAMDWISGLDKENPFFLWLSFAEPHNPYQVSEPYFSMFPPESLPDTVTDKSALEDKSFKYKWTRAMWERVIPAFDDIIPRTRSNYFGMLRLIDDQLKRFVVYLDKSGLADNTIIVFLADHGDFAGEYGLIRKGPELPELLCRVPMVISGPGIIRRGKSGEVHASIVDLMPTLCDAAGCRIPAGVQGKSLWGWLTGNDQESSQFSSAYMEHGFGGDYYDARDALDVCAEGALNDAVTFDCLNTWTQAGTMRAVRKNEWKLIYDMEGSGQLYNLQSDPCELKNLFSDTRFSSIKSEMTEELLKWTIRAQDPLPYPRRRYVLKNRGDI